MFRLRGLGLIAVAVLLGGLVWGREYDFQRYFSKRVRIEPGWVLVVDNPVGEVHITNSEKTKGRFVIVKQRVYAVADELKQSRYMVMMVRLNISRKPDTLYMESIFPTHMYTEYCYPDMGGFFTKEVSKVWHGKKITVSARKGTKLWSDIYLEVPPGTKVVVNSVATTFVVEDFVGDVELFTEHASAMTAGSIKGDLWLTACHGNLSVGKFEGNLFYYGEDSDLSFCDLIRGRVDAQSTTGDLLWNAHSDSLDSLGLTSISGKIMIEGQVGRITTLKNDQGDIEIHLNTPIQDTLIAENAGGDIDFYAPENVAHTLVAKTEEGKVKHSLPGGDKKSVTATLKGDRGTVVLKTQRGTIKIKLKSVK